MGCPPRSVFPALSAELGPVPTNRQDPTAQQESPTSILSPHRPRTSRPLGVTYQRPGGVREGVRQNLRGVSPRPDRAARPCPWKRRATGHVGCDDPARSPCPSLWLLLWCLLGDHSFCKCHAKYRNPWLPASASRRGQGHMLKATVPQQEGSLRQH